MQQSTSSEEVPYCQIIRNTLGKSTVITALNASAQIDWVLSASRSSKQEVEDWRSNDTDFSPTTNQETTTLRN